MRTIELLAPAGSFEALQAAVQNGCDAVYLGGTMFGARSFAQNFDEIQLKEAVQYAHRFGVRVFVTVNTLIKEEEMEACLTYIETLQDMDVDALIIQDIGLFQRVHTRYPSFELHASTQMHIHNPQGIALLREMGAKRVVLPRETPLEQIAQYASLHVDLEVFVQGALCVSYSGQCLLSAQTLDRSGNRGECAQSCRMQYELIKENGNKKESIPTKGKYLLSPKDLNTIERVPELIEAGITSFKIEGRMKRPEYVAIMVASYRKAIDAYIKKQRYQVSSQTKEDMKKIFHRGFSEGHIFHALGNHLMNYERPNHMGIEIGVVTGFHHDKIMITLKKDLQQGDGIRILTSKDDEGFTINRIYKNGLLVNHACANDRIEIDKTCYVEKGSRVVKTSDLLQLKQLRESYAGIQRRIPIQASFSMHVAQPIMLDVWDEEGNYIHKESDMLCEKAHHRPLDQDRIHTQLQKSKDTPFDILDVAYDMDEDAIIAIREINQLRRDALEALSCAREIRYSNRTVKEDTSMKLTPCDPLPSCIIVVHTMCQYRACVDAFVQPIYVDNITLYEQVKQNPSTYLKTPRVMKQAYAKGHALVEEHGGIYDKQNVLCGTSCNVYNHDSANVMFSRNAQGVCVSLEVNLQECIHIQERFYNEHGFYGNFIYPIYGREEVMVSEYCTINAQIKDGRKQNCGLCRQGEYALMDNKKRIFPIQCDEACRMHILSETPRHRLHEVHLAKQHHITSFLCTFTKEDEATSAAILQQLKEVGCL